MISSSYGHDLVNEFKSSNGFLKKLSKVDEVKELYKPKFKEDTVYYSPESTAFINTAEISKTAQYFQKHGVYTKADPLYDKYEFNAFWDAEEKKRKEGIDVYGELYKEDGEYKLRKIHITGEHYGYLNFAQINLVEPDYDEEVFGDEYASAQSKAAVKDFNFPAFYDGDYYFFNAVEHARKLGKHLVVAKARRKGYSYKNGWIGANRLDLYPRSVTAYGAYDADSLYPEGTFTMAKEYISFLNKHTDWNKRFLKNSEDFYKVGYRLKSSPSVLRGYKSVILAKSFGPAQPGALRGKDATLVIIEEAGKARNLREMLDSTLPTLSAGRFTTGLMIVFGTGGGKDSFWEEFEDLFYDPDTDDFLCFENAFDNDSDDEYAGFFVPDFANKDGFIDEFGNSMVKEAKEFELDYREKLKKKNKLITLRNRGMEYCFSPKEAFNRASDNIFPKDLINNQLHRIRKDERLSSIKREGVILDGKSGHVFKDYKLMDDIDYKIHYKPSIWDLRLNTHKDNHGSFVMFNMPHKVNGQVPDNLYRIWVDPFGVDKEKDELTSKHSFGCIYVYERSNNMTRTRGDRLIGVYVGRPSSTETFNDILYKISLYYNAKILYEKNVGDTYSYFRNIEELERLVDTPTNIFDKQDISRTANKPKGIHINDTRKRNGALYLKDWLLQKVDKDENGNWIRNIHYIYDEALLKELLKWNLKGNFDRVSTLIVGMYDIKESYFVEVEEPMPETYEDDSIFNRGWGG